MAHKYAFLVNPNSGSRKGEKTGKILQEITHGILDADFYYSKAQGDLIQVASSLSPQKYSHIIAVGGNGTVNEVANGIHHQDFVFGVIPCGTGNDFMKMTGASPDPKVALQQIITNKTMLSDYGIVTTDHEKRIFMNGCGFGFDAIVADKANRLKKLGVLSYVYSVFSTLFQYKEPIIHLQSDELYRETTLFLMNVGNGKSGGGIFELSPGALLNDGLFHVALLSGVKKRRVPVVMPKVLKGTHIHEPEVHYFTTARLSIDISEPMIVHTDGEILKEKTKKISIELIQNGQKILIGD